MKKVFAPFFFLLIAGSVAVAQSGDSTAGVSCTPNYFWVVTSGQHIIEFELNGNTVINNGVKYTNVPGFSLEFCKNLNSTGFSPTFYTNNSNDVAFYYDGTSWVQAGTCPVAVYNGGGNGNYLYFLGTPIELVRYDGTNFNTIYNSGAYPGTADVAVDDNGNCWLVEAPNFPVSSFLDEISPTGTMIKQYKFVQNVENAYGSTILNGVFYIGLGSTNSVNPNTLVPVTLMADSATFGTPLIMPSDAFESYDDMASCNAGIPTEVANVPAPLVPMMAYPNPTNDFITISVPASGETCYKISVTDVTGRIVNAPYAQHSSEVSFNLHELAAGVYFIQLSTANKTRTVKVVRN